MRRTLPLAAILLVATACASAPSTERPYVPGRPEVPRPEGIESEGLAEVRDSLAAQRTEAREMENVLNFSPTELDALGGPTWYESAIFQPITSVLEFLKIW